MKLEFSRQIFDYCISNLRKSFEWEPSYSARTDRRTDMTKLIVTFRNFAKAPDDRQHSTCLMITNIVRLIKIILPSQLSVKNLVNVKRQVQNIRCKTTKVKANETDAKQ